MIVWWKIEKMYVTKEFYLRLKMFNMNVVYTMRYGYVIFINLYLR